MVSGSDFPLNQSIEVGGIPWYTNPSEKYEFVSWDDEIPNCWMEK